MIEIGVKKKWIKESLYLYIEDEGQVIKPSLESFMMQNLNNPKKIIEDFRCNGFSNSSQWLCYWHPRFFFGNDNDYRSLEQFIDKRFSTIVSSNKDLEVIMKMRTFLTYYFDTPVVDYLSYYNERFDENVLAFEYSLYAIYEGNELKQNREIDKTSFLNNEIKISDKRDFEFYFVYKILVSNCSFFVSFTITTPNKLGVFYEKEMKQKDFALSYPFIITNSFYTEKIFEFVNSTFDRIKVSSKYELLLKLHSIMSIENCYIQQIEENAIGEGDVLKFHVQ